MISTSLWQRRVDDLGAEGSITKISMPIHFRMLRADNKAQLVKLPWTFGRVLTGRRHAVQSGRKIMELRWSKAQVQAAQQATATEPVHMWRDGRRNLWQFLDDFYWDDEGLEAEDVKALVLQRKRGQEQKLQSARSLMRAEENGRRRRVPLPTDLRRAVFERDGGHCVECRRRLRSPVRPYSARSAWRCNDAAEPPASMRRVQPAQERLDLIATTRY